MAASVETSTFNAEKPMSRKRKQDYNSDATASKTSSCLWSDYVCSSPSSPATTLGMQQHYGDAMAVDTTAYSTPTSTAQALDLSNLDAMFATHGANQFDHSFDFYNFDTTTTHLPTSGSASRRHSVAVGELDFHSFDTTRNTFDMQHFDNDLQRLLAMPSSCSPSTSSGTSTGTAVTTSGDQVMPQAPHKRTASLRLETSLPMQQESTGVTSPSTPAFFSPGFLEALYSDEDKNTSFLLSGDPNASFTPPMPLTSTPDQQQQPMVPISSSAPASSNHHDFLLQHHAVTTHTATEATIAPSAISNNDMHAGITPWMMNQQQEPVYHQKQSRRSSCMRSPPGSPSNTSTMSSSSPSPPITPMQPGYGSGYDIIGNNSFKQQQLQHATIPEEDEEMTLDRQNVATMTTWTPEQQQRFRASKSSLVTARMLQGANTASVLKPHIQQYLMSNNPAGSGERTVMILTSKVAQKSYGTEKR